MKKLLCTKIEVYQIKTSKEFGMGFAEINTNKDSDLSVCWSFALYFGLSYFCSCGV